MAKRVIHELMPKFTEKAFGCLLSSLTQLQPKVEEVIDLVEDLVQHVLPPELCSLAICATCRVF